MLENLNEQVAETQQEVAEVQEQPQQEVAAQQQESQKEYNHRMLRERAERAEYRIKEFEQRLRDYEEKNKPPMHDEDDSEDYGIEDDLYVEGKQIKKIVGSLSKQVRQANKKLQEYQQSAAMKDAEDQLKYQFKDFNTVLSEENVKRFAAERPMEFKAITSHPDHYGRGLGAYNAIKNSGMLNGVSSEPSRIQQNMSKPKAASTVSPSSGETPLTRVGDYDRRYLTEERKQQLYEEMRRAQDGR